MRAAVLDQNNKVKNLIIVDSLDFMPGLVDGGNANIGDVYSNGSFVENIEQARAEKIGYLKSCYLSAITADIDYMGNTYSADKESQELLVAVLSPQSAVDGMYWRDINKVKHAMTYADLQGLAKAMVTRGLIADSNLVDKTGLVEAAVTIAEIEAITW